MSRQRNAPVLKSVAIVRTGLTRPSSVRPWSKLELLIAVPQQDGRASDQGVAYLDDSRPPDSKEIWCAAPTYPGPGCPEDEDHKHPLVGWGEALKSGQLSVDTTRDLDHCSLPLADIHARFLEATTKKAKS